MLTTKLTWMSLGPGFRLLLVCLDTHRRVRKVRILLTCCVPGPLLVFSQQLLSSSSDVQTSGEQAC